MGWGSGHWLAHVPHWVIRPSHACRADFFHRTTAFLHVLHMVVRHALKREMYSTMHACCRILCAYQQNVPNNRKIIMENVLYVIFSYEMTHWVHNCKMKWQIRRIFRESEQVHAPLHDGSLIVIHRITATRDLCHALKMHVERVEKLLTQGEADRNTLSEANQQRVCEYQVDNL